VVGRGSFVESFPLFGYDMEHYDALFAEKLELLLQIRESTHVRWSGEHRAALTGQGVYPRPFQSVLPVKLGVGGTPQSFIRAGILGLPLVVAIIGGEPRRFRSLIDLYRATGRKAGHPEDQLTVAVHSLGFLADSTAQAADTLYPAWARTFTQIGKERGWPPATRPQFDATRGPTGSLLVGDPEAVAEKIVYENQVLGGLSGISFLMTPGTLPHKKVMHAIELLGTRVAPIVKKELARAATADHQLTN
jgi:alkanesulfonate monooxygenase SsuD/methylene tetrahydromethanopterin reductase-like flavin-dependent oxidoreductase (luciferase family)